MEGLKFICQEMSNRNHLHVVIASISVMDDKLPLGRQIPWRLKDMVRALRNTEQRNDFYNFDKQLNKNNFDIE